MSNTPTWYTRRTTNTGFDAPTEYDPASFDTLGWLTITEHGQENTYFTLSDGTKGFVKLP